MKTSKGFTIIELLVVIAIIAVLAAVVMVNVTGYINKGKNSAIKGNMANLLTSAALYFDTNPSNTGSQFVASTSYTNFASAVQTANGGTALTAFGSATAGNQNWCSCSVIYNVTSESGTYCVDSTGYKKVTATACATRCPSAAAPACVD